jgi:phosphoribosylanthranilate isomerase
MEEARMAIEFGAHALGLVGQMPSGPGVIPDELIREIAAWTPPPVSTFLLTSYTSADKIIRHHEITRTSTIQIVDAFTHGSYSDLRNAIPAIKLVQVIHVIDESSVDEAISVSEHVDALLLDSGNPNLPVKKLGGTGNTHDWSISRKIRESVSIPVFLAGGLNPDNVREAITEVNPWGIDVCSGVRTKGALDMDKLEKFLYAID